MRRAPPLPSISFHTNRDARTHVTPSLRWMPTKKHHRAFRRARLALSPNRDAAVSPFARDLSRSVGTFWEASTLAGTDQFIFLAFFFCHSSLTFPAPFPFQHSRAHL